MSAASVKEPLAIYQFLVDDFRFVKSSEQHAPEAFGNFSITLTGEYFMIHYVQDRLVIDVQIESLADPDYRIYLSFVQDLIRDPDGMNSDHNESNEQRIEGLNGFIKKDFDLIRYLFRPENYPHTKKQIEKYLLESFKKKFPMYRIDGDY